MPGNQGRGAAIADRFNRLRWARGSESRNADFPKLIAVRINDRAAIGCPGGACAPPIEEGDPFGFTLRRRIRTESQQPKITGADACHAGEYQGGSIGRQSRGAIAHCSGPRESDLPPVLAVDSLHEETGRTL